MKANTAKRLMALETAKSAKPIRIVVLCEGETDAQARVRGQQENPGAKLLIVDTGVTRAPDDPA